MSYECACKRPRPVRIAPRPDHNKVGPFLQRQIAHAISHASVFGLPQSLELLHILDVHTRGLGRFNQQILKMVLGRFGRNCFSRHMDEFEGGASVLRQSDGHIQRAPAFRFHVECADDTARFGVGAVRRFRRMGGRPYWHR